MGGVISLYDVYMTITTRGGSEYRIECYVFVIRKNFYFWSANVFDFKDCKNNDVVLARDISIRWKDLESAVIRTSSTASHAEALVREVYERRAKKRARDQAPKRIREIIGD